MKKALEALVPSMLKFSLVARHQSISRAATELNISQPALSKIVRSLEASIGVQLIYRTSKGVAPTEAGLILTEAAQNAQHEIAAAIASIESLNSTRDSEIRMAATPLAGAIILPRVAIRLQQMAPDVRIRAIETNRNNSLSLLLNRELDVVLASSAQASEDHRLYQERLFEDQIVPWMRSSSRLAKKARVSLSDLAQSNWIMPQRESNLSGTIEKALYDSGVKISGRVFESSSVPIFKSLLLAEDRIAILDRGHLTNEIEAKLVTPLNCKLRFDSNWHCLYTIKIRTRKRIVEHAIAIIREVSREVVVERRQ